LVILLLVILAAGNIIYYATRFFTKAPHIKYPAFGIDIPPGYSLHGIDVSRYQDVINWSDVKDMQVKDIRIGFVFIKATEGTDKVDAQFSRNWLNAEKENIPRGAYHYFIASRSGKAQADNFIEIAKLKKGDLPPVLDIEEMNDTKPAVLQKRIKEWLDQVEEAYGIRPIIYTNIHFYNTVLKDSFEQYPVWIAHYLQPGKPRIDRKWTFWQHSESGRVNGIKTKVDFNVFSGDSLEFRNLVIK
jgi:lysozyme